VEEKMGTVRTLKPGRETKEEPATDKGKEGAAAAVPSPEPGGQDGIPKLSENALRVLEKRYLKKDSGGRVTETPGDMFRRVAETVAGAEGLHGGDEDAGTWEGRFYSLMTGLEMLPNSPTLMNAGRELGQLSACFVLPVLDSMESIFEAIKNTALIHKSGGGTGFSFSRIRPRNDEVCSTKGISSGPISFMTVFDAATETIKQGGMRRGANMGVLAVDHPDILEFISCKKDSRKLNNFNISVGLTEAFMEAVDQGRDYPLRNPRSGNEAGRLEAREVFERIVNSAWENGEPGILFLDRINRDNPTPVLGAIESTNPCGEQPLFPYESCNLGSLNLSGMVRDGEVDWDGIAENTRTAVRFLDDVIDVNRYPLEEISSATRANRKIGLGVMGFADMLIRQGIPYDSLEATEQAEKVMEFVAREALLESERLAGERGPFPNFSRSVYAEQDRPARRNATITTIAPTGTISLIAGCSSGIEPLFALAFVRHVMDDEKLVEINPLFEEIARAEGFFSPELLDKVLETGSVRGLDEVPEQWQRVFVTAHDISPEWHIRMQAAFQKYTDNSVSKTVNFPGDASVEDVRRAFLLAYELGCKGMTIYRDRSRDQQVLQTGTNGGPEPQGGDAEASSAPSLTPRPRPQAMKGITRRMETSCGALYITVNWDQSGRPFEVFTSMGKAGGCASSQSEAIGRLVSLGLRSGVDPDQIIRQLRGISCHLPRGMGKNRISSCADAVAQALQCFFHPADEHAGHPFPDTSAEPAHTGPSGAAAVPHDNGRLFLRGACPECQGILEQEGGCSVCRNCGYSDCG
jgi:ribonucleoside-diphosphate reductase alpha chain